MELFTAPNVDYQPVEAQHFVGDASVGRVLPAQEGAEVRMFRVTFGPQARTNWHLHTGVQVLYVQEGNGLVQKEGEAVRQIGPGDTVYIRPGERHWHGASAEESMTHLAINVGGSTEWLREVTADEYGG